MQYCSKWYDPTQHSKKPLQYSNLFYNKNSSTIQHTVQFVYIVVAILLPLPLPVAIIIATIIHCMILTAVQYSRLELEFQVVIHYSTLQAISNCMIFLYYCMYAIFHTVLWWTYSIIQISWSCDTIFATQIGCGLWFHACVILLR